MTSEESTRSLIVEAAREEIGPGDIGKYWEACSVQPPYPPHWCGAFALWAIKQGNVALDVPWLIGRGFCEIRGRVLKRTRNPLPGDVAYTDQPFQHHAVVESLQGGTLVTIDGNQPDVRCKTRPLPGNIIFYSIDLYLNSDLGPLKVGSSGNKVRLWQTRMNVLGFTDAKNDRLDVDGNFGGKTQAATLKFQVAYRLPQTGVVGPEELKRARSATEPKGIRAVKL